MLIAAEDEDDVHQTQIGTGAQWPGACLLD